MWETTSASQPPQWILDAPTKHAGALPTIWVGSMGPDGFAVLPITTLDPPHRAASPVIPALIGSGSPLSSSNRPIHAVAVCFGKRTEFAKILPAVLSQPGHHFRIAE